MIEPTRIIAIRHGETAWNADTRIQGHIDIPLSDVGRRQAALLGQALSGEPVTAIYASDLSRAWETAEYVGRAVDVAVTKETARPTCRDRSAVARAIAALAQARP
jgi:2,3-bisphosphoglycerate-dependent phosphoglycerate mutase